MNDMNQLMTTTIIPVFVSALSAVVSIIAFALESRAHKKAKKTKEISDRMLIKVASNESISKRTPIDAVSDEIVSGYLSRPLKATVSLSGNKKNRTKYAIPSYSQACAREQSIRRITNTLNAENQKKYIVIINSDEHDILMRYRVSDRDLLFVEALSCVDEQVTSEKQPLIEKSVAVEATSSDKIEYIPR